MLDLDLPDPKLDVAIDEALLLGRHYEFCGETLRFWTPTYSVLLPRNGGLNYIDVEGCKKFGVAIIRRCSAGDIIYSDNETLNFSLVLNERAFGVPSNPSKAYEFLYGGVQRALNKLGLDTMNIKYAAPILSNGKIVSMATQHYYYDNILFHGAIFVNSNLSIPRKVIKSELPEKLTTLSHEIGRKISIEEMKNILSLSFQEVLGVKFTTGEISEKEKELLDALYKRKYSLDKWNIKGEAPLTLKDALVEVYIAYPPTPLCRSLLSLVKEVIANLRERVELRIWYRGMRVPPGIDVTPGLKHASKCSIIPAVIINGELKFGPEVPSENDLRRALEEAIVHI